MLGGRSTDLLDNAEASCYGGISLSGNPSAEQLYSPRGRCNMPSKNLFSGQRSIPRGVQATDTVNEAGGVAYAFGPEHALAQYALTGTFNGTFYASDEEQMKKTLEFAAKCSPLFVAKTAVYAREHGYMKDMPAFLLAYLAGKQETALMKAVFTRVVDSPKMVRNFVQMIRSGQLGRKSLGTAPKRLIQKYFDSLSDDQVFRADVGNSPSLPDIIKLARPAPKTKERAALYGYLLDKKEAFFMQHSKDEAGNHSVTPLKFPVEENLVAVAREYEEFKHALLAAKTDSEKDRLVPPNVPFLLLTALPLTDEHWKTIARRASWTQVRMNLNTFARHGVFKDSELVKFLADKLANKEQIQKARAFPYQLFAAYSYLGEDIPAKLRNAVADAADIAIDNVPKIEGDVVVCPDVSGSMSSPITGHRKGSTSKMRCIDIAALCAAAVLRQNPEATILEGDVVDGRRMPKLNARDSVLTNAEKLAAIGGGSTNCSAPLRWLNSRRQKADLIWFVSDNESWVDRGYSYYGGRSATGTMAEFVALKSRAPKARMILHDIQPNYSTQGHEREDVMNVGGFSDSVFDVVASFSKGEGGKALVDVIKAVDIGVSG
jgi:60 kDa SS-A/Ro ribonucleoprotein